MVLFLNVAAIILVFVPFGTSVFAEFLRSAASDLPLVRLGDRRFMRRLRILTISENSLLKSLQNVNIKARIEAVFRAGQHSSEV
jgi:hypothetical protein